MYLYVKECRSSCRGYSLSYLFSAKLVFMCTMIVVKFILRTWQISRYHEYQFGLEQVAWQVFPLRSGKKCLKSLTPQPGANIDKLHISILWSRVYQTDVRLHWRLWWVRLVKCLTTVVHNNFLSGSPIINNKTLLSAICVKMESIYEFTYPLHVNHTETDRKFLFSH